MTTLTSVFSFFPFSLLRNDCNVLRRDFFPATVDEGVQGNAKAA